MFRKKDKHGRASKDGAGTAAPADDAAHDSAATDAADATASAETGLTPKKAKNAVRVAKIVIPAVVPALAPLAVKAAGTAREAYDRYQARRLGVTVDALPEYAGKGGLLLARIAGASQGLRELRRSPKVADDDLAFAEKAQSTLEQLTASVRASERMPSARRRAAHKAVAAELEHIEAQLLHRLGI